MDKKELEFRKELLKEMNKMIEFYEGEVSAIELDLLTNKTFKNDTRYVNMMAVLTNLNSTIMNLKNQRFGMQREIERAEENLKAQKEVEKQAKKEAKKEDKKEVKKETVEEVKE